MTLDVISLAVLFVIVAAVSAALIAVFSIVGKRGRRPSGEVAAADDDGPISGIAIDDDYEKSFMSVLIAAFLWIAVPFVCLWAVIFRGALADGSGIWAAAVMLVFLTPVLLAYLYIRRVI